MLAMEPLCPSDRLGSKKRYAKSHAAALNAVNSVAYFRNPTAVLAACATVLILQRHERQTAAFSDERNNVITTGRSHLRQIESFDTLELFGGGMRLYWLRDDQWERIKDLLPGKASDRGVTARDNRLFVEAVLWVARTGAPWRDLPDSYGHWHRVYVRYDRWSRKGVWLKLMTSLAGDADLEHLMMDGSIVRVHQHDAAKKQSRPPKPWVSPEAA